MLFFFFCDVKKRIIYFDRVSAALLATSEVKGKKCVNSPFRPEVDHCTSGESSLYGRSAGTLTAVHKLERPQS